MLKYFLKVCMVLIFLACTNSNEVEGDKKVVNFQDDYLIENSDLDYELLDYIVLQDTSLSQINKLEIHEENIFVMEAYGDSKLLRFNKKGEYLNSIGKKGKGPGEFLRINDFQIYNNHIYLFDPQSRKVLKFDFENNFIEEFLIGFIGHSFQILQNGNILFSVRAYDDFFANSNPKLILLNEKFKFVKSLLYWDLKAEDNMSSFYIFRKQEDNYLSFHYPISDTIFYLDSKKGEIVKKIVLDFGEKRLPLEYRNNISKLYEHMENQYSFFETHPIVVMENFLIGNLTHDGIALSVSNLKENKTYMNHIDPAAFFLNKMNFPFYFNEQNKTIICLIDYELYSMAQDKDELPKEIKTHLENGSIVLTIFNKKNNNLYEF